MKTIKQYIKAFFNCKDNCKDNERLAGIERQIIDIKFPHGFKIGNKAKAKGYGDKPIKCFINSNIYMKHSVPYIDIFIPSLSPPNRSIHAEDVF